MTPLLPLGAGFKGQTMTWSAVWSIGPQMQLDHDLKPHLDKQQLKRPTPVRRRFRVDHSLRGRSDPGGSLFAGDSMMLNCGIPCNSAA